MAGLAGAMAAVRGIDVIETIEWHTLHPRYLGADSRVIDLGANHGQFSRAMTQRFGCSCVAVEPSPGPFAAIPDGPRISKMQVAVADRPGTMQFHVASESTASSLVRKDSTHQETIDVRVITLSDLIEQLAWPRIDVLKVDIEGAEIAMLASCSDALLGRVAQLTIEFHDFCGITPAEEVNLTIRRLSSLGFWPVRMSGVGHQDTWLINRRLIEIPTLELMLIRHGVRNWNGFRRVVKRQFFPDPNVAAAGS
jgi:FkbM family methyltransferase